MTGFIYFKWMDGDAVLSEERPKEQKVQEEEKRSKNGTLRYSAHEGELQRNEQLQHFYLLSRTQTTEAPHFEPK